MCSLAVAQAHDGDIPLAGQGPASAPPGSNARGWVKSTSPSSTGRGGGLEELLAHARSSEPHVERF
jgi:hypothetical protein